MNHEALLERKLLRLFPDERLRVQIRFILDSYGLERHEKEPDRVRLAILKLSEDRLEEIQKYMEIARQDYRDVLAWAEYPRQSLNWSLPEGSKKQEMKEADRKEYETWLNM